jgi:hypothetical protein
MKKMIAGLGLLTFVILIVSMSGETRQSGKICDLKNLKENLKSQVHGLGSPTPLIYGYFGLSVGAVPDVNGDGRADIAVLEPNFPNDNGSCGRVHIYSGASGKFLRSLLPVAGGTFQAGLVFQSSSVSGVPDVNGDGKGDIVVGAPSESPGNSPAGAGRAYIYSGATGALLRTLKSPADQLFGNFGLTVAGVPDVNGDGRGDVVVGALYENPGNNPTDCGRAYIYSGASGVLLRKLASPTPVQFGHFGNYVSGVQDVNGDGRGDVIVGAMNESTIPNVSYTEGRAYLFSGATGVRLRTFTSPKQVQLGGFGEVVASIPDVDGDGRGDILITAPGHDPASSLPESSGMAYLYSGATGALLRQFVSPNKEINGWFGFSASGVQDVTGDGRGDIVIGAVYENAGGLSDAGRAYIFSGATGTLFKTLVSPSKEGGGNFGFGVVGLPSSVRKAKGYVLVGAPYEDPGSSPSDCGRAYIFKY